MSKREGSHKYAILHDALILTLITLFSGLALSFVHEITLAPIAAQTALQQNSAYQAVFPDAEGFEPLLTGPDAEMQEYLAELGYRAQTVDAVSRAALESGEGLGYVITITTSEGYGGDIQLCLGVRLDGTLNGISILSISETAGLGMRADTEEFKGQFANKSVYEFRYTKTGARGEDEIDALSGATITTRAMTDAVNAGLAAFRHLRNHSIGGDQ